MNLQPITLTGKRVRLEPLGHQHVDQLLTAAGYDEVWTYLDEPTPSVVEHIEAFVNDALRDQEAGSRLPFAVVDIASSLAVGSTSYIDIRPRDRGVEVGWTWLTPDHWSTGLNREAKYLLLRHAFEDQQAIRVALKTDLRNVRSQRAIESLGAVREGVWRNHRILSTGAYRDSVFYSVIASEWPATKVRLEASLMR